MQQTNQPTAFSLAAFFAEALPYVSTWTPTDIDSGGCGIFAKMLSEHLTKEEIPHKIYALYFDNETSRRVEEVGYEKNLKTFLKSNKITDKDHTGCEHVCVLVDDEIYVDSKGIINMSILVGIKTKYEMTIEQLDELIERGGWNPIFDRGCIPKMEQLFDEAFKQIKDFHSGSLKYPGRNDVTYTKHTMQMKRKQGEGSLAELLGMI